MAKTRAELQQEFLAGITYNARRFKMRSVGVASLDTAARKQWPSVNKLDTGIIYREPKVPMPKLSPVRDPEEIRKINEGR